MKEAEKKEAEEQKRRKLLERERRRRNRERKRREKKVRRRKEEVVLLEETLNAVDMMAELFKDLELSSNDESDAVCPKCGGVYSDDDGIWICCDGCNSNWYDIRCTNIRSQRNIQTLTFVKTVYESIVPYLELCIIMYS